MVLRSIFLFVFLISLFSCNQNAKCQDFKKGDFIVKFDSEIYSKFERTENYQIETNHYGEKIYYTIEWISECVFIQRFDESEMILTDEMKMVNKDGGVVIELLDIIDDGCIAYQSYVKNFKGLSLKKGNFCKKSI